MISDIFLQNCLTKAEQFFDNVYKKVKLYLPLIARLCLLSSFVQDNFVIMSFYEEILELIRGEFLEIVVVVIVMACFVGRAIGCVMILMQRRVFIACGMLVASSLIQIIITDTIGDGSTLMISISVFGGLSLIAAESKGKAKSLFAGVPELDNNKPKDYMQLSGRCLVMFMFFNFISLDSSSYLLVLQDIFGFVMMILVFIGYKTKFSVFSTMLYLNVINLYENNWWSVPLDNGYYRMYLRHKFIQGISVTGGLLMIALYGPGGISIDKAKKW